MKRQTLTPILVAVAVAIAVAGTPISADAGASNRSPLRPTITQKARTKVTKTKSRSKGLVRRTMRKLFKRPRVVTAEKAASLIRGGDKVWIPVGQVASNLILKTMANQIKTGQKKVDPKKPVELVGLSNTASRSVFDRQGKVVPHSLFIGGNAREPIAAGRGDFVPVYFGRIPRMIKENKVPVDVAVIQVSKPDALGFVTLGPTAGATRAALDKAKTVIAQVNNQVPRTRGATKLHVSKLDYVVKANEALTPIPAAKITATDKKIASHIVKLVLKDQQPARQPRTMLGRAMARIKTKLKGDKDAPTFQFGIGGIPDAVAGQLAESKQVKACKVRSELIGAGTRKLVESGKVKGKVNYTFAMGDQSFLKWMDKNPKLVAQRVGNLNDPYKISKVPNMVAVNSAMKVDLSGQINAQYIRGNHYSGVGGQVDFMRGAMGSKGGKAILALPSVAEVKDGKGGKKLISKIVPRLGEGDVVTTSMHDVQYVVTEHGVAALEGKTTLERARALIKVAHPQFRQQLTADLDAQLASRKAGEQKRYDAYKAAKK